MSSKHDSGDQISLFVLPQGCNPEPKVKRLLYPVWTENKARLIERYLYYFVLITKHGAYIDGFAGPQDPHKPDTWAAKLVLECEPRWLRDFFLFDEKPGQFAQLCALREAQFVLPRAKGEPRRRIEVTHGDFNQRVVDLLASGKIREKEATFCLLDQRTFECHWSTIVSLAHYKTKGNKVELFYFLPNSWLDRALAAQKDTEVLERWWGGPGWEGLRGMKALDRAMVVADRLRKELGYASAKPLPIYQRQDGGSVMYYMIHATDHPEAPLLMNRAYRKVVSPKETPQQFLIEFETEMSGGGTLDPLPELNS